MRRITLVPLAIVGLVLLHPAPVLGSGSMSESASETESDVRISAVAADPQGDDVQYGTGEYVELHYNSAVDGSGPAEASVGGWYIRDAAGNRLDVGDGYVIDEGRHIRVYTGPGDNTAERYYNGLSAPVLDNDGDDLRLYDDDGDLVDTHSYEGGGDLAVHSQGFDGDASTYERIFVSNFDSAGIQISKLRFGEHEADYAILARDGGGRPCEQGGDFAADALAASGLNNNGPLLFTYGCSLRSSTRAELDRVLADGGTVYVLGGEEAVSPRVVEQLENDGYVVKRLAGATRIETAIAVADEVRRLHPDVTIASVARAYGTADDPTAGWADSVTGGGWTADHSVPVLLTRSDRLDPAVSSWLEADDPSSTVLFGGVHALSEKVEESVPNARRVAGATRAETATEVSRQLWGVGSDGERRFIVVNGYHDSGWGMGLAAVGGAQHYDAPLLLVAIGHNPGATAEMVNSCDTKQVDLLFLGSTSFIPEEQAEDLESQDGRDCTSTDP